MSSCAGVALIMEPLYNTCMNTHEVIKAMVKSGRYQELISRIEELVFEYSEGQLECSVGKPECEASTPRVWWTWKLSTK